MKGTRDSSLKDAFVGILMTVGPFFGVRYRPPRVEIPVVTTPSTEQDGRPAAGDLTSAAMREKSGDPDGAAGAVV